MAKHSHDGRFQGRQMVKILPVLLRATANRLPVASHPSPCLAMPRRRLPHERLARKKATSAETARPQQHKARQSGGGAPYEG